MSFQTYDDLAGPELDPRLWRPLDLGGRIRLEPGATTTVSEGAVTVDIERFTNADPEVQGFDNCKHVLGSTRAFALPREGAARFEAQIRVDRAGGDTSDYRLGAAAFNVTGTSGGFYYDVLALPDRVYAEHEVLGSDAPFTWVVDAPFIPLAEDGFRTCRVELDPGAGVVTWTVDDQLIHQARGLTDFPEAVAIGFAFFTLVPLASTRGSIRGQGARASWRNFRYDAEVVPG